MVGENTDHRQNAGFLLMRWYSKYQRSVLGTIDCRASSPKPKPVRNKSWVISDNGEIANHQEHIFSLLRIESGCRQKGHLFISQGGDFRVAFLNADKLIGCHVG